MQTTLSRNEYDTAIRRMLEVFLTPPGVNATMRSQYPKDARTAGAELRFRGVDADPLPDGRAYSAAELDQIVQAGELTGWLTLEATAARAAGWGLVEHREKFGQIGVGNVFDTDECGGRLGMICTPAIETTEANADG